MQRLIANFSGRAQRRTENGRSWLVAPVSMIVPGVLAGSKGPLHYPSTMVAQNAGRWNGIPLTLGHPSDVVTNAPLSAHDRGVVDRLGLGVVRNDKFVGGKHRAEAWFDEEKTKKLAPNVYNALIEGRPMEVSTGLFTQEVERSGVFNGRSYDREVTGYTPDHLAILPDQTGACSVRDGCGLNVHNAAASSEGVAATSAAATHNASPGEFAARLLHAATAAHILHLKTKSYSQHKALDELYTELPGLADSIVEQWQGKHGVIQDYPNNYVAPTDPVEFVRGLATYVASNRSAMGDDSELQNSIDEVVSLLDSTLYKLTVLTNATGMPAIPHPADNSAGSSPATPPPSTTPKSDVGMATPPPPAATSSGLGPTISQPPSPATPPPSARSGAGMETPPALSVNDHADPDSECPCGGDCKSCKEKATKNAGCSCGGTCNSCKSKMVENDCPAAAGEEKGENPDSTPEPQPRCPIKQTFQPRGFKGKGRGEAHTAAKQGMADSGDPTTNSLNDDRSSAGHSNNGGSVMDRKQMITHLTTNCDCYKGKAGAVLNSMTDEQLSELITNAQAIAEIRGLNPQFAGLTANAMPAALKAAMDKKAAPAAADDEDDEEEPDGDEAVPVMKGKAPPTGNVRTTEQWLKTAPPEVQRLVRNSLARERKEKEQLIDVLVGNVQNGPAKAALVANYLKMDVELLKAQVDSLPTSNSAFDGGLDVSAPTANYFGAGFGSAPTANRFSNDVGLEVGALGLPTTATQN